jgi:excisionase family DNA binding protein
MQNENTTTERFLTKRAAADLCGVSLRTLGHWIASRALRVVRLSPRCIRIDPADLREFIERRRSAEAN